MKNFKKIIGIIAAFIGLAALSAVESDVPVWGTILIVLVGIIGFFGGAVLYCKNSNQKMLD